VQQGSISPTYLRTAFMPVAPKSLRIQSSCQYLFTLLGSTGAKAALRMLMKLTPGASYFSQMNEAIPIKNSDVFNCVNYFIVKQSLILLIKYTVRLKQLDLSK